MSIWSAIGGGLGMLGGIFQQNKQAKLQTQFAKNSVQWRVKDAQKAGVHPLAALGMQGMSYTPQSIGDMSAMGQNIGNAIHRATDTTTRAAGEIMLERGKLENELLRTQINALRATRTPSVSVSPASGDRQAVPGQPATSLPAPPPEHEGLRGGNRHYPLNSDAQKFEDRYGDIIQEIAGARNFINDFSYSRNGIPFWAYMHLEGQRMLRGRDYGRDYRHR